MKPILSVLMLLVATSLAGEDQLLAILQKDAPQQEKSEACRELARVGTRRSVPVLAPLLADADLSDMARFALEPIDDPAVDAALRDALGKVKGTLLIGVIGSIGVRGDQAAIGRLAGYLTDLDPAVARAAAGSLGAIGGAAAPVLEQALAEVAESGRPAVCEALLRCAEASPGVAAAAIHDKLLATPKLPIHLRVAVLRAMVRNRGADGVALLAGEIRAESRVPALDAIGISMDLPGVDVTRALVAELAAAPEQKQVLLIHALGNRGDATAAPALAPLAQTGSMDRRMAALRSLIQLADASSLPLLAGFLTDSEPAIAAEALEGLSGLPGREVDSLLLGVLEKADPARRPALINACGRRRMSAAVPFLLDHTVDPNASVANASLAVLRELAGPRDVSAVVQALSQPATLAAAESALLAICLRQADPAPCTDELLTALAAARGGPKQALLRVLGTIGTPKAQDAVRKAATDPDPEVSKTAAGVLVDWPAEPGFTPLFNGRDLAGWNGMPAWWRVEDGALTAESTPDQPCVKCNYLIWRGDRPADFELLADFKLSAAANSGIQIRSEELLEWDTWGYQADMTGDGSLVGFVYHHKHGLIAGRGEKAGFTNDGRKTVERLGDAADLLKHFKPGDWNTYRVICRGPAITLAVNGVEMCRITDHRVAPAARRGIIALQMHPGPPMKIQFKNIRLKPLPPEDEASGG